MLNFGKCETDSCNPPTMGYSVMICWKERQEYYSCVKSEINTRNSNLSIFEDWFVVINICLRYVYSDDHSGSYYFWADLIRKNMVYRYSLTVGLEASVSTGKCMLKCKQSWAVLDPWSACIWTANNTACWWCCLLFGRQLSKHEKSHGTVSSSYGAKVAS